MRLPRIFGNKLLLLSVALALILIVLMTLVNVGSLVLTGLANLDSGLTPSLNEANPDNTNTPNNNAGGGFFINVIPETLGLLTNNSDYTNLSLEPPSSRRSHGHRSVGNSQNSNNPGNPNNPQNVPNEDSSNDNDNGNDNGNANSGTQNFMRRLTKKPHNLNLRRGSRDVNEGDEFEGVVRLSLDNEYNQTISTFDINFTQDVDLSDITADTNFSLGKSFMHHPTSDFLENIDLYLPVVEGIDTIVICPGASDYNEIYYGCANQEIFYTNDTGNPRFELSSDGIYYIVHGITGTGVMGVNITNISSSSQNVSIPGSADAIAGNITELAIPQGQGKTQSWQGYYGNVTGTIMLADSGDNVMYNWSLASPEGEVLASTNNSISWDNIQCFNFTSTGTYEDESGNGGETNLHGTNLTQLETQYGIKYDDIDGVDETFLLLGANTHNTFYINSKEFSEGECQNTRIIDSSGWGQDDHFEEALLYEPTSYSVVFASLLNEDVPGFDDNPHDFEMLVLEDGHLTDTATTTYYFYAVMF